MYACSFECTPLLIVYVLAWVFGSACLCVCLCVLLCLCVRLYLCLFFLRMSTRVCICVCVHACIHVSARTRALRAVLHTCLVALQAHVAGLQDGPTRSRTGAQGLCAHERGTCSMLCTHVHVANAYQCCNIPLSSERHVRMRTELWRACAQLLLGRQPAHAWARGRYYGPLQQQ